MSPSVVRAHDRQKKLREEGDKARSFFEHWIPGRPTSKTIRGNQETTTRSMERNAAFFTTASIPLADTKPICIISSDHYCLDSMHRDTLRSRVRCYCERDGAKSLFGECVRDALALADRKWLHHQIAKKNGIRGRRGARRCFLSLPLVFLPTRSIVGASWTFSTYLILFFRPTSRFVFQF